MSTPPGNCIDITGSAWAVLDHLYVLIEGTGGSLGSLWKRAAVIVVINTAWAQVGTHLCPMEINTWMAMGFEL